MPKINLSLSSSSSSSDVFVHWIHTLSLWIRRDHKNTVNRVHWNKNGNWLLSASADRTARVFDIRTGKELQTFFGHETEISCCNWHPIHENLFVTCGFDGSMRFWEVGYV
jgi:polyadenylation factor subunit 2